MTDVTDTQTTALRRQGTLIPKVFEIGPVGGLGKALRQVTSLSDTDTHKHKLGLPDMPQIACKLWFDPQEPMHIQIMQDGYNAALLTWQIDIEEGNSPNENVSFTAYVVDAQIDSIGVDADLVMSFSLKPQSIPSGLFDTTTG